MISRAIGFFIVTTMAGIASAPARAETPKELQGTWKLVSVESGGEANELGENAQPRLVIQGDRIRYGGRPLATVSGDAGASPKVIDLRFAAAERTMEGIYQIEGDTLRICLNKDTDGARERPSEFATRERGSWRLLVFHRDKGDPNEGLSGFVGVALRFEREKQQVAVDMTFQGSPASKAGLQKGDVVLKVDGVEVTDLLRAVSAVRKARPGSKLVMHVRRGEKEMDVTIEVDLLPFSVLAGLN